MRQIMRSPLLIMCGPGGLGLFSGSQCFYVQHSFGGQVILHALSLLVLALKPFLLPAFPFLWVGLGKYLKTFHCGSQ